METIVVIVMYFRAYILLKLTHDVLDMHHIWRERERNVLFNDALNTFYLRLYGVRHMVKDHSDSVKGNPLPPHRLLLKINSKGSFICTIPHQDSTCHGLWYTSRGALAGTRNSSILYGEEVKWVFLVVNDREEGVMALHRPILPLKTRSAFELGPRFDPAPTSPLTFDFATAPSRPFGNSTIFVG